VPNLLQACRQILCPQAQFLLVTAYAIKASALTLYNGLNEAMRSLNGEVTAGEVVLNEKSAGRLLSTAIYSRWNALPAARSAPREVA